MCNSSELLGSVDLEGGVAGRVAGSTAIAVVIVTLLFRVVPISHKGSLEYSRNTSDPSRLAFDERVHSSSDGR